MLIPQPLQLKQQPTASQRLTYPTDKAALSLLLLAMTYLFLGLLFGVAGGFQYLLPSFLKEALSFQKVRPLHVFLVISWIFTAAQGGLTWYLPRITGKPLLWKNGAWLHLALQAATSTGIIAAFFMGRFGGREYLEFPPVLGVAIALSWLPFALNFFGSFQPFSAKRPPVYYFSWTLGILFFFITLSESYLWVFDHFNQNIIRDTTVQWKALGSMVGSWNMLVYGTSLYIMEQMKGDRQMSRAPLSFFFFFLGFTNLLFNWGHHTYIVPADPAVKTIAYVISMTELLIFGHLVYKFRKTMKEAQKQFHSIPFRLLSYADLWIFLNLGVAIALSIPAINFYTHGTHITVAHAMGTTIGINTMLLFASLFYILQQVAPEAVEKKRRAIGRGMALTNMALILFWTSLVGSGIVKILGKLDQQSFASIMQKSQPFFRIFTGSGIFILVGLAMMISVAGGIVIGAMRITENE